MKRAKMQEWNKRRTISLKHCACACACACTVHGHKPAKFIAQA